MVTSSDVFRNSTLVEVFDDLCVRFIINLPNEELGSVERVYFQIEEAQWYFEDFVRKHNPYLPTLGLRPFAARIFQHCPILQKWGAKHEEAFADFMAYKTKVPVRGAVMLNETLDKCVLVKGYKSSSLSFPRGKINKEERDEDCAAREVLEETGFDLTGMVNENDFIEITMREQNVKLYVVPGIPEDTDFQPRTRNEISSVEWHRLSDLPTYKKKKNGVFAPGSSKFYMVTPFVAQLREWIATRGSQWLRDRQRPVTLEDLTEAEAADDEDACKDESYASQPMFDQGKPPADPVESQSEALRSLLGLSSGRGGTIDWNPQERMTQIQGAEDIWQPAPSLARQSTMDVNSDSKLLLQLLQKTSTQAHSHSVACGGIAAGKSAPDASQPLTELLQASSYNPKDYVTAPTPNESHDKVSSSVKVPGPDNTQLNVYPNFRSSPRLTEQSATLLRTLKSGSSYQSSGKSALLTAQYPVGKCDPELSRHTTPTLPRPDSSQAHSLLSILRSGGGSTSQDPRQSTSQSLSPANEARPSVSSGLDNAGPINSFFPQLSALQNNAVDGIQRASLLAAFRNKEHSARMSPTQATAARNTGPHNPSIFEVPAERESPLMEKPDREVNIQINQTQTLLSRFRGSETAERRTNRSTHTNMAESSSVRDHAPRASAPTPTDQGFLFDYLEQVGREAI